MKLKRERMNYLPMLSFITFCVLGILLQAGPIFASPTSTQIAGVYEAAKAELGGTASIVDDVAASGGKAVGDLWQTGNTLTFHNIDGGYGGVVPCTITYSNGGSEAATTNLAVNGASTTITLPSTGGWGGAGKYQTVTCQVNLKPGTTNTVVFSSTGTAWVCDKIAIHPIFSTAFSSALQNNMVLAMTEYWPYMLVLIMIGLMIMFVRAKNQYY